MPKPKPEQKRPFPIRRLTLEQRVAITECMSVIALLTEAKTAHAKELAMIVLMRIKSIGDGAQALPAPEEECMRMVEFANANSGELERVS